MALDRNNLENILKEYEELEEKIKPLRESVVEIDTKVLKIMSDCNEEELQELYDALPNGLAKYLTFVEISKSKKL